MTVSARGSLAEHAAGGVAFPQVAKRKKPFKIKHPGALNRDVGGNASERLRKVEWLAEHGTPEQRKRARFYLKVLRPASKRRSKA